MQQLHIDKPAAPELSPDGAIPPNCIINLDPFNPMLKLVGVERSQTMMRDYGQELLVQQARLPNTEAGRFMASVRADAAVAARWAKLLRAFVMRVPFRGIALFDGLFFHGGWQTEEGMAALRLFMSFQLTSGQPYIFDDGDTFTGRFCVPTLCTDRIADLIDGLYIEDDRDD